MKTNEVAEGDSVTLHTGINEPQRYEQILWSFGPRGSVIAQIPERTNETSFRDEESFRDRLQLDSETGDLTIRDVKITQSGDYQLKLISARETKSKTFKLILYVDSLRFSEGENVALDTGVSELTRKRETPSLFILVFMKYRNMIDDGRLRDRVRLDDQSGSLTISNSRSTDTGVYQLQITNSKETFYKRYNVFVVTGIAGVCYSRRKYSRLKDEMKTNEVAAVTLVTLHTGINEPQRYEQILWSLGSVGSVIAQIPERTNETSFRDEESFRDRLQLDSETGDLTIRDVKITQSGDYQLKLISARETKSKTFKLILYVDSLRFSEGENVALDTGVSELQRDDQILWTFGSEDTVIAKRDRNISQTADADGRFGDRLQMDDQTGSLRITNTKSTDSGVYQLQISSRNKVSYKKFRVTVWLDTVKVTAGDSVTLNTGMTELEEDSKILWTHGDHETCIAKINRATNKTSLYRGNDVRFRDRLQLDHRTGSLTIWNISITHSDVYKLQISSRRRSKCKRFVLIVDENTVSVMEGDRAELNTDVSELQRDALILWMFGPRDSLIAKADLENRKISTYDGAGGRFRDRLELDLQTRSLSITSTTNTDSGLYKLKIISSRETRHKRFRVTVCGDREREISREDTVESSQRENTEDIALLKIYSGTSV
ncbi:uncharacterized protein LOC107723774 [Sinocyclocheilus rhinocerous]|uniref:uncharacterized protein LOC107723774 n=1 Tax=Sinocyclocheilus rhinocerous TaxID=307959 RepID=UPI0007B7DD1D|nr:PREDICTED: uncharacterized protein LOC107723774 [Sinocyclocheilus rhinocerous]